MITLTVEKRLINVLKLAQKAHISLLLLVLMLVVSANTRKVFAEGGCVYNGYWYPEGAVIGAYQCQYGRWVRIR
ncbi:MAG: hypothetical protein VKL42_15195 [Snowella sp.]|nr:hypothetical protein [Snowella sp.]